MLNWDDLNTLVLKGGWKTVHHCLQSKVEAGQSSDCSPGHYLVFTAVISHVQFGHSLFPHSRRTSAAVSACTYIQTDLAVPVSSSWGFSIVFYFVNFVFELLLFSQMCKCCDSRTLQNQGFAFIRLERRQASEHEAKLHMFKIHVWTIVFSNCTQKWKGRARGSKAVHKSRISLTGCLIVLQHLHTCSLKLNGYKYTWFFSFVLFHN